jgi:hypothetical protein
VHSIESIPLLQITLRLLARHLTHKRHTVSQVETGISVAMQQIIATLPTWAGNCTPIVSSTPLKKVD